MNDIFLYCLMPSREKIFDSNANDQCIPIRAAGVSTEESDFLMFPRSFSAEFQLSQLAAEETGITFAYFSSVVPHFNTDVLTFFLCHFSLPPTSALSVVFGANCSIGGSDIKSRCGWLACLLA